MSSTPAKRGRKAKDHKRSWDGETVNGLYRKPGSNVWRVRATGQEFTEPDERQAIARFERIMAQRAGSGKVLVPVGSYDDVHDAAKAATKALRGTAVVARIPRGGGPIRIQRTFDTVEAWAYFREQVLNKPEYAAKMTGIEWLAWHDHKRPEKAAGLEEIGETYFTHSKISDNELSRSRLFWSEFEKVAKGLGTTRVNGINHELAHAYEAKLEDRKLSPKSKLHRYQKVRTILHFNIKRGKSIEHCRKALDVLAMLEVKDAHPLDPTPISVEDFWAIHREAEKAGDDCFAALLLMALNCALYGGEVAAVRWNEIDLKTGGFVSRRSKTGVSRIGMLWPETLKAIKPLPRVREEVFCTRVRSYTVFSVGDKFNKYRDAAGIDKAVTFSWINAGPDVPPPDIAIKVIPRKLSPEERDDLGRQTHRVWLAVQEQQRAAGKPVDDAELRPWDELPDETLEIFRRGGEAFALPEEAMWDAIAQQRKLMGEFAFRMKLFEMCVSIAMERMLPHHWTEAERQVATYNIVKLAEMLKVPPEAECR